MDQLIIQNALNYMSPFLLQIHSAALEAELGNFEEALTLAEHLKRTMMDTLMPEQFVLYANIYFEMDSLKMAKRFIEKAIELDSMHLIAQGLRKQIDKGIMKKKMR